MPTDIKGKEYFTVAERLTMARGEVEAPSGIQSIDTEMEEHGGIVIVRATVTFQDGRRFTGMSMVKGNATSPAERDAPVETCETSAVGRALAMAGYHGSPEGIAGAEELHLAASRAEARAASQTRYADGSSNVTRVVRSDVGTAAPRPVSSGQAQVTLSGPSPAQVRYLNQLWEQAGRPFPPPQVEMMERSQVSKMIDELRAELGIPPKP